MQTDGKLDLQAAAGKVYSQTPSREKLEDEHFICSICTELGSTVVGLFPYPFKNCFYLFVCLFAKVLQDHECKSHWPYELILGACPLGDVYISLYKNIKVGVLDV